MWLEHKTFCQEKFFFERRNEQKGSLGSLARLQHIHWSKDVIFLLNIYACDFELKLDLHLHSTQWLKG